MDYIKKVRPHNKRTHLLPKYFSTAKNIYSDCAATIIISSKERFFKFELTICQKKLTICQRNVFIGG